MRKAFTSHAVFVVTQVLRLPRNSQVTRYLIIIGTFLISASLHVMASPGIERCSTWPQVRYYLSTITAICLEDLVIMTYRWLTGRKRNASVAGSEEKSKTKNSDKTVVTSRNGNEEPNPLWKLLGYTWVVSFQVWAASKLVYGVYVSC